MAGPTATTPDLWLKADAGVYEDAGTDAAENNDGVWQWNDQSGNARHALQATSGSRPLYKTLILNGLPGILFDASDDFFDNAYTGEIGCAIVVCKTLTTEFGGSLLGADCTDSFTHVGAYDLKAGTYINNGADVPVLRGAGYNRVTTSSTDYPVSDVGAWGNCVVNIPIIYGVRFTNSGGTRTVKFYKHDLLCDTQASTNTLNTIDTGRVWIGASAAFSNARGWYYNGYIFEVLIWGTDLSDAEYAENIAILEAKWALARYQTQDLPYMMSSFQVAPGVASSGREGLTDLYIWQSYDGMSGQYQLSDYRVTSNHIVRDPSLYYDGTKIWVCHTSRIQNNSTFDVASSTDGRTFTYVSSPDCSSVVTGSGANRSVWAPQWFTDATASQGVRVLIALSADNSAATDGNFVMYEMHPTNAAFTTWSAPTAITGTGFPASMIDATIQKIGSTYYMFVKNEVTSEKRIEVFSSSSLTSGYVAVKEDDWAGWGSDLEGPHLLNLGDDFWRIFLDNVGNNIYASDSFDGILGPYKTKRIVTLEFTPQHSDLIANPFAATSSGGGGAANLLGGIIQ